MKISSKRVQKNKMVAAFAAIICAIALIVIIITLRMNMPDTHHVLTVAHRGGAAVAPENTLAAFKAGIDAGADALELDIHLSRDGAIMVMHDPLLERTTNGIGALTEYTRAELEQFNASSKYSGTGVYAAQQIPTLEDVLHLLKSETREVGLQVEIKLKADESRYAGIEEKLISMLKAYDLLDRTTVISFDFPTLMTINSLEPSLKRGALISKKYMTAVGSKGPSFVASHMEELAVDYVGVNFNYLSANLYKALRDKKLGVGVWTVNDANSMQKFRLMGVDFITSDNPSLLVQENGKELET